MSKILEQSFENKMNIVFTALNREVDWGLEEQIQDAIDSLGCSSAVIDLGSVALDDLTAKKVRSMDPDEEGDLQILSMVDLISHVNIVVFKNTDKASAAMKTALFELMHSRFFVDRTMKDLWSVVVISESKIEMLEALKSIKSDFKTLFLETNSIEE